MTAPRTYHGGLPCTTCHTPTTLTFTGPPGITLHCTATPDHDIIIVPATPAQGAPE
jgi:hypothetical protein